jgi:hypothetical protein
MTSYLKMATAQEEAMCVLWFFDTLRTLFTRPHVTSLDEVKLRIVVVIETVHRKCWRKLGGKLNTAGIFYMP